MNVVITGAGSGIGRATAARLAARGDRVVLCDVNERALTSVVDELGEAVLFAAVVDVADAAQMERFAHDALAACAETGGVGALVNNAGVAHVGGLLETTLAQWDWLLGVNLRGVIHGCHFFAPAMVGAGRGVIVNVASVLGFTPLGASVAYVASKFAVMGLSQSLHRELAPKGVAVCAICPGLIATNILGDATFGDEQAAQARRGKLQRWFAKSGASPGVVADAIVAALSKPRPVIPVTKAAWLLWAHAHVVPENAAARLATLVQAWNKRL